MKSLVNRPSLHVVVIWISSVKVVSEELLYMYLHYLGVRQSHILNSKECDKFGKDYIVEYNHINTKR